MTTVTFVEQRLILNYSQDFDRDIPLSEVFVDGVQGLTDAQIRSRVENHFDLGERALADYVVTRKESGVVIRPQAVYG